MNELTIAYVLLQFYLDITLLFKIVVVCIFEINYNPYFVAYSSQFFVFQMDSWGPN